MANIVSFLINDIGISQYHIILILGLPFIAVIIGIARYYIGIRTFNLYSPILLCIAYFLIQEQFPGDYITKTMGGILYGSFVTVLMIFFTIIASTLYKSFKLHYFPKVSLIFSTVIILMIVTLVLLQFVNVVNLRLINISSFILILVVYERFINIYSKKKLKTAVQLAIETILLALICYIFLSIYPIQAFLLANPWVIIFTIPANYIIGRFTGLRLNEYIRFQDILNKEETPEDESK